MAALRLCVTLILHRIHKQTRETNTKRPVNVPIPAHSLRWFIVEVSQNDNPDAKERSTLVEFTWTTASLNSFKVSSNLSDQFCKRKLDKYLDKFVAFVKLARLPLTSP